jgi:hypothetical protein
MRADDAKKLKELEHENTRLKQMGLPPLQLTRGFDGFHAAVATL